MSQGNLSKDSLEELERQMNDVCTTSSELNISQVKEIQCGILKLAQTHLILIISSWTQNFVLKKATRIHLDGNKAKSNILHQTRSFHVAQKCHHHKAVPSFQC